MKTEKKKAVKKFSTQRELGCTMFWHIFVKVMIVTYAVICYAFLFALLVDIINSFKFNFMRLYKIYF